jgi:hypothetical protein
LEEAIDYMNHNQFDPRVLKDPSWWHWVITIPLLVASLAGVSWAMPAAVMLCGGAAAGYYAHVRWWRPFPVQVRLAFLVLLFAGALPWMTWLHVVQLCGTSAMVTIGYCPLARLLTLTPWNRDEPFTKAALWRALAVLPRHAGLLRPAKQALQVEAARSLQSCSLQTCSCSARVALPQIATELAAQGR